MKRTVDVLACALIYFQEQWVEKKIDRKMKHACGDVITSNVRMGAFSLSASGTDYVIFWKKFFFLNIFVV